MTNLRDAREAGQMEAFIAEREDAPPGDADALEATVRRLAETSKAARPASKRRARDG
jgi:hypothetical protein